MRVPLAGRRVRGYVIGPEEGPEGSAQRNLKKVRSVSSPIPVFTEEMLPSLQWAAGYYIAPLAGVLAKTGPPNLPKPPPNICLPEIPPTSGDLPDEAAPARAAAAGKTVQVLSPTRWARVIRERITPVLRDGKSALVIVSTAVEASRMANRLQADLGDRIIRAVSRDNAALTAAWSQAVTQGGLVVVGTPRTIWWPVSDLSMIVLVEEGRKGMKERQTPTFAVGALARARSARERLQLVLVGQVPALETLYEDTILERIPGRLWSRVEIVDRTQDPPGTGLLAERVRVAIASTVRRGGRVFVFTHRRGYAPAARCIRCRRLRTCPACGSRPDHRATCPRCEAVLGACDSCGGDRFEPLGAAVGRVTEQLRRLMTNGVGSVESLGPVMVGTERDLVGVPPVDLAVVVDADGLVRGTNYRSMEEALRVLARAASTVTRQGAGRMILQTADPHHPVYDALRRGDPMPFLRDELAARRRFSLPPVGEVMVVEVEGTDDASVFGRAFEGAEVYGPARAKGRIRWIVQSRDLRDVKVRMRAVVARLRNEGCKVRLDIDPREF